MTNHRHMISSEEARIMLLEQKYDAIHLCKEQVANYEAQLRILSSKIENMQIIFVLFIMVTLPIIFISLF